MPWYNIRPQFRWTSLVSQSMDRCGIIR